MINDNDRDKGFALRNNDKFVLTIYSINEVG